MKGSTDSLEISYLDFMEGGNYSRNRFQILIKEEFMDGRRKRKRDVVRGEPRSRRTFLLAGGAMVTGFALTKVHPSSPEGQDEPSQRRIREIVNRYGSELGKARLV